MSNRTLPLDDDGMYHIYNRATGSELLFTTTGDYTRFLKCMEKYLLPFMGIWCYCLMPNHFHLLITIKEKSTGKEISKALSDCCNAYTKWLNTATGRKGNLFMRPFKRNKIENDNHLAWTVWYIHRNPMHHHYSQDYSEWKYSSFKAICNDTASKICREHVLSFFGGVEKFILFHKVQQQGYYDAMEDE